MPQEHIVQREESCVSPGEGGYQGLGGAVIRPCGAGDVNVSHKRDHSSKLYWSSPLDSIESGEARLLRHFLMNITRGEAEVTITWERGHHFDMIVHPGTIHSGATLEVDSARPTSPPCARFHARMIHHYHRIRVGNDDDKECAVTLARQATSAATGDEMKLHNHGTVSGSRPTKTKTQATGRPWSDCVLTVHDDLSAGEELTHSLTGAPLPEPQQFCEMTTPSSSPETHKPLPASPSVPSPLERSDSEPDVPHTHSSRTPSSASVDFPLLPDAQPRIQRSHTVSPIFVSSPLNPNALAHSPGLLSLSVGSRGQPRQNVVFNRVASEESQALTSHRISLTSNRASMILYRLAGEDEQRAFASPSMNRQSVLSNSGDSVFTVSYDSKYPSGAHTPQKLVPYPFDPSLHINTPEDDDALHDPLDNSLESSSGIPVRGLVNVGVLVLVIAALLCLFIFYPIWHYVVQGNSTVP